MSVTKLVTACLLFAISFGVKAQSVKGVVYHGNSDTVVANAVVYYSGSISSGTLTDKNGGFELRAKAQPIPIVISCVGYYSSIEKYQEGKLLIVRLKPRLEALHMVTIRPDGLDRKTEIAMFTREFIGTSEYAQSCTITNIDDVNLFYDKKTRILTANCPDPIVILNKKLGYIINYYLDNFVFKPGEVTYTGNYVFKENIHPDDRNWQQIRQNRLNVYNGSRMQFIRDLWQHATIKQGYSMYNMSYKWFTEDELLLRDSLGQKFLSLPGDVNIANTNFSAKPSALMQTEDLSFVNKEGYYGAGLKWGGAMGGQRMGDLLPFEYQPEKEFEVRDSSAAMLLLQFSKPKSKAVNLRAEVFKRIALVADDQYSDAHIKKWEQPIYYRIYGTTGNKAQDDIIHDRTVRLFDMMSRLTGLPMNETDSENTANFLLVIGELSYFKEDLDKAAYRNLSILKDLKTPEPGDYRTSKKAFTHVVQLIDVRTIGAYQKTWNQLRSQILNGLGFLGRSGNQNSLFYGGTNNWEPKAGITAADQNIISTLYQPGVRPGMTASDLDIALKSINLR